MLAKQKIKEQLNNINFKGLDKINLGDAIIIDLYQPLLIRFSYKNLMSIFIKLISSTINYQIIDKSKSSKAPMFFYSQCHRSRQDYWISFENLGALFCNKIIIRGCESARRLNLSNLVMLWYLPIWFVQLSVLDCGFFLKLKLLRYLQEAFDWTRYIKHNFCSFEVSSLVVLFDARFHENILVQIFRESHIPTATLQHGHFISDDLDTIFAVPFNGFISDKFFVWGEYTKQEALKAGIAETAIRVVGNPKYIGMNPKKWKKFNELRFVGVVLEGGGKSSSSANIELLDIAIAFAEQFTCKIIVKPHPVSDLTYFQDQLKNPCIERVCKKNESVIDFGDSIDIAFAMGSSVYAELLNLGICVFRFLPKFYKDRYARIKWGAFSNLDELIELIQKRKIEPESFFENFYKARDFLNEQGDISQNYIKTINELERINE
jgi:hypothetical protein